MDVLYPAIKHNLHMLIIFQSFVFIIFISLAPFRKNRANYFLLLYLVFQIISELGGLMIHSPFIRSFLTDRHPAILYATTPFAFLMTLPEFIRQES